MTIELLEVNGVYMAEIVSDKIEVKTTQGALDIMANCNYLGAYKIILREENIINSFFDLKTGIAGDILQKFSTYRCQLAIVGDFGKFQSKSLKDFIYESNKVGRIHFVASIEEAKNRLANNKE
jgi:hypothetical protein